LRRRHLEINFLRVKKTLISKVENVYNNQNNKTKFLGILRDQVQITNQMSITIKNQYKTKKIRLRIIIN
jgi:hypothetical protein